MNKADYIFFSIIMAGLIIATILVFSIDMDPCESAGFEGEHHTYLERQKVNVTESSTTFPPRQIWHYCMDENNVTGMWIE